MKKIILIWLCCWLSPVLAANQNFLILGDSLSAGYNLAKSQSWPELWQQQLTAEQSDWQIINASISGETTQGALARLPSLLKNHQPKAILIEIGANDGLRGYPIKAIEQNLEKIISLSLASGSKVVLMQIRIPPNYGPKYTEQFIEIYPKLSKQTNVVLWPFFMDKIAIDPTLMQADGLHPTAQAQPIIKDLVNPVLKQLLSTN
jgi:acyl-CoA thioesterase-1